MENNCTIKFDSGHELRIGDVFYGAIKPNRFNGFDLYSENSYYDYDEILAFKVVKLVFIELSVSTFFGHTVLPNPELHLAYSISFATEDLGCLTRVVAADDDLATSLFSTKEEAHAKLVADIKAATDRHVAKLNMEAKAAIDRLKKLG